MRQGNLSLGGVFFFSFTFFFFFFYERVFIYGDYTGMAVVPSFIGIKWVLILFADKMLKWKQNGWWTRGRYKYM